MGLFGSFRKKQKVSNSFNQEVNMHSYIILAIKVPIGITKALDSAGDLITLMNMQGIEDITILNTIPAP